MAGLEWGSTAAPPHLKLSSVVPEHHEKGDHSQNYSLDQLSTEQLRLIRDIYEEAEKNGHNKPTRDGAKAIQLEEFPKYVTRYAAMANIVPKKMRKYFWGSGAFDVEAAQAHVATDGGVREEHFPFFVSLISKGVKEFKRRNWREGGYDPGFFWEWGAQQHVDPQRSGAFLDVLRDKRQTDRIAAHMVKSAVTGQQIMSSGFQKWRWALLDIVGSLEWSVFRWFAILAHCFIIFVENPFFTTYFGSGLYKRTKVEQTACYSGFAFIAVYWTDLIMKFFSIGPKSFLGLHRIEKFESEARKRERLRLSYTNRLTFLIVLLLSADVLLETVIGFQTGFLRVFRPVLFVCNDRKTRQMISAVVLALPNVWFVFTLIALFLFVMACIGLQLYIVGVENDYYVAADGTRMDNNFDNMGASMLSLFELITTENYPTVMWPVLQSSRYQSFYFMFTLFFGAVVLVQTTLAMFLDQYGDASRQQLLHSRKRVVNMFVAAYQAIGTNHAYPEDKQLESFEQSSKKSKYVEDANNQGRPKLPSWIPRERIEEVVSMLKSINVLDYAWNLDYAVPPSNRQISLEEFVHVGDAVQRHYASRSIVSMIKGSVRRCGCGGRKKLLEPRAADKAILAALTAPPVPLSKIAYKDLSCRGKFEKFMESVWMTVIESLFVIINAVAMAAFYRDMTEYQIELLDKLCCGCQGAFMGIMLFRMISWGKRALQLRKMAAFFVELGLLGTLLVTVLDRDPNTPFFFFRLIRSLQLLRLVRLMWAFKAARPILLTFFRIRFVLARLVLLMLVFIYMFAVLGMWLFANKYSATYSNPDDPEPDFVRTFDYNFDHFYWAMLSLFQVFMQNGWPEMLARAREAVGWYAIPYFISYYILVCWLLGNAFVAMQWEVFGAEQAQMLQNLRDDIKQRNEKQAELERQNENGLTRRTDDSAPEDEKALMAAGKATLWEDIILREPEMQPKLKLQEVGLIEELGLENASERFIEFPMRLRKAIADALKLAQDLEHEHENHFSDQPRKTIVRLNRPPAANAKDARLVTSEAVAEISIIEDLILQAEEQVDALIAVLEQTVHQDGLRTRATLHSSSGAPDSTPPGSEGDRHALAEGSQHGSPAYSQRANKNKLSISAPLELTRTSPTHTPQSHTPVHTGRASHRSPGSSARRSSHHEAASASSSHHASHPAASHQTASHGAAHASHPPPPGVAGSPTHPSIPRSPFATLPPPPSPSNAKLIRKTLPPARHVTPGVDGGHTITKRGGHH